MNNDIDEITNLAKASGYLDAVIDIIEVLNKIHPVRNEVLNAIIERKDIYIGRIK